MFCYKGIECDKACVCFWTVLQRVQAIVGNELSVRIKHWFNTLRLNIEAGDRHGSPQKKQTLLHLPEMIRLIFLEMQNRILLMEYHKG